LGVKFLNLGNFWGSPKTAGILIYMPGVPSKGRYFNELMAKINYIYMFYGVNEGIFLGGVQK